MSSWGAWQSFVTPQARYGTPAQDLVKSLINIQDRRDIKQRLKRQEERQARLDAIAEQDRQRQMEWEDLTRKASIAAQQSGYEETLKKIPELIGNIQMQAGQPPETPPAEREKVTEKQGADGSMTRTVDRPLAETPVNPRNQLPEDLINIGLGPELDLGDGPQTPGVPEVLPLIQEMERKVATEKEPMTASYQGQEVALPYMEEAMRQKQLQALMSPQVMSAQIRASRPLSRGSEPLEDVVIKSTGEHTMVPRSEFDPAIHAPWVKPTASSTRAPDYGVKAYTLAEDIPGVGKKGETKFLTGEEVFANRAALGPSKTAAMRNKEFEDKDLSGRMGSLIEETKRRLTNFQAIPLYHPIDKGVAWNSYVNSLGSLGQIFGRQVLRDVRVSEQDRAVYASTVGVMNLPVAMLSPEESWARMILLEKLTNTYSSKYGDPPEGSLASDYLPSDPSYREQAEAWVQDQLTSLERQYEESGGGTPPKSPMIEAPPSAGEMTDEEKRLLEKYRGGQ